MKKIVLSHFVFVKSQKPSGRIQCMAVIMSAGHVLLFGRGRLMLLGNIFRSVSALPYTKNTPSFS
jgi:hypothetical protein